MDRFIELVKTQSHAEFRLFVEYWWLWVLIVLVCSIVVIKGEL